MKRRDLAHLTGDVLSDIVAVLGIPTNTARSVFGQWMTARGEAARQILFEQLRKAEVDGLEAANQDEAIGIIYRYLLAVRDGAARRNLRLLAMAIADLAKRDRLFSTEFNEYAEALSRLSRNEILVIERLHHFKTTYEKTKGDKAKISEYWQDFIDDLVPGSFLSEEHILAVCCSGLRSGLFVNSRDWDSDGMYTTSPFMLEVSALVDFEEALATEGEL